MLMLIGMQTRVDAATKGCKLKPIREEGRSCNQRINAWIYAPSYNQRQRIHGAADVHLLPQLPKRAETPRTCEVLTCLQEMNSPSCQ